MSPKLVHIFSLAFTSIFCRLTLSVLQSGKTEHVMVGTYSPISCTFNRTLKNNVFYMFLSWDADNALAYLFNERLVKNKGTDVYKKAVQHKFSVERASGQNTIILTIQHVSLKYNGLKIMCLVKDDDGRGAVVWKETTTLAVIDPPKILRFPEEIINVTRGDVRTVVLLCAATGYPPPMLRWWKLQKKQYHLLTPQTYNREKVIARYQLPTPFTDAQDGNYRCEALTENYYMESIGLNTVMTSLTINVRYPPEIRLEEQIVYTDIGWQAVAVIRVASNPIPVLRCDSLSMAVPVPKYMRLRGHPSPHRYVFEVSITNVRQHHIADYRCIATNSLGSDATKILLRLGPDRPRITSSPVTRYSNYFELRWSTLSAAALSNCTVELSTMNDTGNVVSVRSTVVPLRGRTGDVPKQIFIYHISNLTSATFYSIRVRTCNRYHCSPFSRPHKFKTARFDGSNTVDPRILRPRMTTIRPSNIRTLKRCSSYDFSGAVCSGGKLVSSYFLTLLSFVFIFRHDFQLPLIMTGK